MTETFFQILKMHRMAQSPNSSNMPYTEQNTMTPLPPIRAKTEHDVSCEVIELV